MKLTLLTFVLFLFQVKCYGTSDGSSENFEILYHQGQDAYLENNFELCVKKMEAALVDYKYYNKVISACKLECQKKVQSQQHVVEHILGRGSLKSLDNCCATQKLQQNVLLVSINSNKILNILNTLFVSIVEYWQLTLKSKSNSRSSVNDFVENDIIRILLNPSSSRNDAI